MKRFFLIFNLFFITNLLIYSQVKKGDVILDFTGSYIESINNSGVSMSNYSGKTNTIDVGFSFGYSISNSFILGLGIEYDHIKDIRNYSFSYYNAFFLAEQMEIKTNVVSPLFYLKYYKQVFDKLLFSINFNASYGFTDSNYQSMNVGASSFTQNNFPPFSISNSKDSKGNYLSIALQPEFNYFLTEKLGLIVKIGGVRYNSYEFKDHEWKISLNPSNWDFGLFLRFGKK